MAAAQRSPIVEGEWVDPAIPLPDHAFRKTAWWGILNRATRPALFWITNSIWLVISFKVAIWTHYPPLDFFLALCAWTGALYGVATYEKRLGIA